MQCGRQWPHFSFYDAVGRPMAERLSGNPCSPHLIIYSAILTIFSSWKGEGRKGHRTAEPRRKSAFVDVFIGKCQHFLPQKHCQFFPRSRKETAPKRISPSPKPPLLEPKICFGTDKSIVLHPKRYRFTPSKVTFRTLKSTLLAPSKVPFGWPLPWRNNSLFAQLVCF